MYSQKRGGFFSMLLRYGSIVPAILRLLPSRFRKTIFAGVILLFLCTGFCRHPNALPREFSGEAAVWCFYDAAYYNLEDISKPTTTRKGSGLAPLRWILGIIPEPYSRVRDREQFRPQP